MKSVHVGLSGLLLGMIASSGLASETRVYRDSGGMPRCLESNGFFANRVLLNWGSPDRFEQKVRAYDLDRVELVREPGSFDEIRDLPSTPFRCEEWEKISQYRLFGPSEAIDAKSDNVLGIPLTADLSQAIGQISRGGSVYRAEESAAEYLAAHPIQVFDRKLNRALTAKYGAGFSGEIYKILVNRDEQNTALKARLLARIALIEALGDPAARADIPEREQLLVLTTDGFGGSYRHGDSLVRGIQKEIELLGLRLEFTPVEGYGQIRSNSRKVHTELENAIRAGKKIILVGISRGAVETLTAIADLEERRKSGQFDAGPNPGKIIAFLNFSGLIGGSFIADWVKQNPILSAAGWLSRQFPKDYLRIVRAAAGGGTKEVTRLMARNAEWFPKDLFVLNVVGIPGGNALIRDENLHSEQEKIVREYMLHFGANDGLIEFPGTEVPRTIAPRNLTLALDGNHYLFKESCSLDGRAFEPKFRHTFLRALVETLVSEALDGHR